MTYRQAFDRLGNPVYRRQRDWQHRVIRWASAITAAACMGIAIWGR